MARTAVVEAVTSVFTTRDRCRLCNGDSFDQIWSFGTTPLANSYLKPAEINEVEPFAPLTVYRCQTCSLVQLRDVVRPELLFSHYLYVSSTSPTFVAHFESYAKELISRFKLDESSLVVDVGSNDGILLKPLQAAGIQILGIDPAENVAALANAAGIETRAAFFTPTVAKQIAAQRGRAAVITANNVFAHTDDVALFVEAVQELLAEDGAFVFEVQYLGDLLEKNLFDIVYHEHLCYYHVTPLVAFFKAHGMEVFDVQRPPVHGGSIRVFVARKGVQQATDALRMLLTQEAEQGLNTVKPYRAFGDRILSNKGKLRDIINGIKAEGKTIAGFGAPAKATTLMYAFGLTSDDIQFIVDDSPLKQNHVMPGTHIPIYAPDALYSKKYPVAPPQTEKIEGTPFDTAQGQPDYCLILAWNFADSIMKNHGEFTKNGGKWIIPIPEPRVV